MKRRSKRASERAVRSLAMRTAIGDLIEATAPRADLTAVCMCSRAMRPRVGRCGTCAAAELKTLGVDVLKDERYRSKFKVVDRRIVRVKGAWR